MKTKNKIIAILIISSMLTSCAFDNSTSQERVSSRDDFTKLELTSENIESNLETEQVSDSVTNSAVNVDEHEDVSDIDASSVEMVYNLQFDVNYSYNFLFSKYDIDVYLDGNILGSVINGEHFNYSIDVTEGTHDLSFSEKGKSSIRVDTTINIQKSIVYTCTLFSYNDKIEINEERILDAEEDSSLKMEDFTGVVLSKAVKKLESKGCKNIICVPSGSHFILLDKSNWTIVSQTPAAGTSMDRYTDIEFTCVKTEEYGKTNSNADSRNTDNSSKSKKSKKSSKSSSSKKDNKNDSNKSGESFSKAVSYQKFGKFDDDFKMKIRRATESSTLSDDLYTYKPDGKFLTIEITMKNVSKSASSFDATKCYLEEKDGTTYVQSRDFSLSTLRGYQYSSEVLNPKSSTKTKILFDIPKKLKRSDVRLVYEDGYFTTEYRYFKIN